MLRRARLLTQADLAKQAGVGYQTVVRVEQDRVDPQFSTIRKLAKALDVDPFELVRDTVPVRGAEPRLDPDARGD